MTGFFGACTNEDAGLVNGESGLQLVKAPKVIAYSGDYILGTATSRANAGDGDLNNQTWRQFNTDALENITDAERQAVLEAIEQKTNGNRISEDVVFPWENYFLQDVISAQNGSWQGAGSNGTSSSSYAFEAWHKGADCRVQSQWYTDNHTSDYENYELVTNSAHMNQYFQKVNADGSQTRINETTLMTGMELGTYEEMKGKQFRWYINCHENLHWYEYITVQVDGNWYICFDFGCGHKENDVDGNPGRGAELNDWDYNDWIIKILPAVPNGEEAPAVWPTPDEPEKEVCDKCGHPSHGETCPDCEENEGCNHKDEPVVTPDPVVPDVTPAFKDEVEVNLHGTDKNGEYLESHLSIHVRAATDVEIFIPVPNTAYLDADDMAIVMKHEPNHMKHGGPYEVEYKLKDSDLTVKLTIAFEEDGIRVTTDGITEEVIEWCGKKCHGDGITFEIWNYFNDSIDLDTLKGYLNKATIKFLDKEPDAYINAFNKTEEGVINEDDCTVSIVDEQRGDFEDAVTGKHLNGSPFNEIYKNKSNEE